MLLQVKALRNEMAVVEGNNKAPACPVCLEVYCAGAIPLVSMAMTCGHHVCLSCLEQLQKGREEAAWLAFCPTCKVPIAGTYRIYI
jgi:hypothetical protein